MPDLLEAVCRWNPNREPEEVMLDLNYHIMEAFAWEPPADEESPIWVRDGRGLVNPSPLTNLEDAYNLVPLHCEFFIGCREDTDGKHRFVANVWNGRRNSLPWTYGHTPAHALCVSLMRYRVKSRSAY